MAMKLHSWRSKVGRGTVLCTKTRSVPLILFSTAFFMTSTLLVLLKIIMPLRQIDLVHHHLGEGEILSEGRHGLRIAVLSNSVLLTQDRRGSSFEGARVWGEHVANKECYCKLHGYDFILDSRHHVEGTSYAGKEINEEKGITVHYNKPFLIRKWLPHYDWILWLDMDAFIVDLQRPVENFITSFRGEDIHVLIPQEQQSSYFFSAYALLIRNSSESRAMVEDWFSLKDECPYAKFHDQQRLYIALLHMVLKYEGEEEEVDRNDAMSSQTDCMQFCMSENSAKHISHCFGEVLHLRGYREMPDLKPPLAISHSPWKSPRNNRNVINRSQAGLGLQGSFGPVFSDVSLIDISFVVHVKPKRYDSIPSPLFIAARLDSRYLRGMKKCWGENGWFADPVPTFKAIAQNNARGHDSDVETTEYNKYITVPAVNVRYTSTLMEALHSSKRRVFGIDKDRLVCVAASLASGANTFAKIVLLPIIEQYLSGCDKKTILEIAVQGYHRTCFAESSNSPYWPHMLFKHDDDNNLYNHGKWKFTFLRHPLDRILISFLLLKSSLSDSLAAERDNTNDKNENPLNLVCIDSNFVALRAIKATNKRGATDEGDRSNNKNTNLLFPELTFEDYVQLDTGGCGRDAYSKFYLGLWDFTHNWMYNNEVCEGSPRVMPHWSDDDEKHTNQWIKGHQAAGALLNYHFYGIFEYWDASIELLKATLGLSGSSLPPIQFPTKESALLIELKSKKLVMQLETLKKDPNAWEIARKYSAVDFIMYEEAQKEFKQRCNAFGIEV